MNDRIIDINNRQVVFRYTDKSYGVRINDIPCRQNEDNDYIFNEVCKIRENEKFKLFYEHFNAYVDVVIFGISNRKNV